MAKKNTSKKSSAKKNTSKKSKKQLTFFNPKGMKVMNVRSLSDTATAFSLCGNGLGLYNLKVIEGKKGAFIATPSTEYKGKYYDQYALYLDTVDQEAIIDEVYAILAEDDEDDEDDILF